MTIIAIDCTPEHTLTQLNNSSKLAPCDEYPLHHFPYSLCYSQSPSYSYYYQQMWKPSKQTTLSTSNATAWCPCTISTWMRRMASHPFHPPPPPPVILLLSPLAAMIIYWLFLARLSLVSCWCGCNKACRNHMIFIPVRHCPLRAI